MMGTQISESYQSKTGVHAKSPWLLIIHHTIKKTQSEAMLEIETLGKKSGTIDVSNKIQESKRESQVQKIPYRTLARQSKTMQNAKRS